MAVAEKGASPRALGAAIEIMEKWMEERERLPLDRIAGRELKERHYLNSSERRYVSDALFGTVRYLRRQDRVLKRLKLQSTAENRIRLWGTAPYQNIAEGGALNTESPWALPVEESLLRAALGALPNASKPHDFIRFTLSFPDEMAESLETMLGSEAVDAARALNEQAPVTLRVNTLRASKAQVMEALPEAKPTRWSPTGLVLPSRVNAPSMAGFKEGWYEIQEEASQVVAMVVAPRPGQTVVELGAGAGGKSLAMAALMEDRGRILAIDTSGARLAELRRRTSRAGVHCIEPLLLPPDTDPPEQLNETLSRRINEFSGKAQRVIVDAPCTGSGILRRSPDGKWRPTDREAVVALQRRLLTRGADFAAPRGRLIYVTCAFETWQNEEIIDWFLESPVGKGFTAEKISDTLEPRKAVKTETPTFAERMKPKTPYLRTWPHRHGLDAFFIASLERRG